jgi:hypothetical protein
VSDKPVLDRRELQLYGNVLLDILSGPYAARIRGELGRASVPIYEALLQRTELTLASGIEHWQPDDVDWAALRSICPAVLTLHDEAEFATVTGFTFDDVRALQAKAEATVRAYYHIGRRITYQIGSCRVNFPIRYVASGAELAAVPDAQSWDDVVPECARGRRDEFLAPLRRRFQRDSTSGTRLWVELPVRSITALEAYLRDRAAPWELEILSRKEAAVRHPEDSR